MSIINGASFSRFIIGAVGDAPEVTIDLPLTNSSGLIETTEARKIEHELISLNINAPRISIEQQILGYFIYWTFHYDEFVTGETLLDMQSIFRAAKSGNRRIMLIPRVDIITRQFEVLWDGEPFDLGIRRHQGFTAIGSARYPKYNRLPVFRFKTKEMQPDLGWQLTSPFIEQPGGGSVFTPIEGGM